VRRAFVTGGTRGIGFATCALLQNKGYAVTAIYSTEGEDSEKAKAALPEVDFRRVDVSDEAAVRELLEKLPAVDLLVNNAGIDEYSLVQDISAERWERLFSVNVEGMFFAVKHAVKKMIQRGSGAIVNVSSIWGRTGASCESAYSATKGAVISFTKALSKELAPSHITVNCVAPGVIETRMNEWLTDGERKALEEEIPLGRFGTPEEVAEAIYFLGTHSYITGEILGVDGGFC